MQATRCRINASLPNVTTVPEVVDVGGLPCVSGTGHQGATEDGRFHGIVTNAISFLSLERLPAFRLFGQVTFRRYALFCVEKGRETKMNNYSYFVNKIFAICLPFDSKDNN